MVTDPRQRKALIAARLKVARERAGISQKQLGEPFGVTDVTVGDWERGKTKLSIDRLESLGSALGVPLAYFLADEVEVLPRPPHLVYSELGQHIHPWLPVYDSLRGGRVVDYVAHLRLSQVRPSLRAYRLPGLSLPPRILEKDTLIIDTDLEPQAGDLVLHIIGTAPTLGVWPIGDYVVRGVVAQLVRDLTGAR